MKMRIGEYVALIAAADMTGHLGVGVLLLIARKVRGGTVIRCKVWQRALKALQALDCLSTMLTSCEP